MGDTAATKWNERIEEMRSFGLNFSNWRQAQRQMADLGKNWGPILILFEGELSSLAEKLLKEHHRYFRLGTGILEVRGISKSLVDKLHFTMERASTDDQLFERLLRVAYQKARALYLTDGGKIRAHIIFTSDNR